MATATKYFVTRDTTIFGLPFKAGDELAGVPENRIPNLLRVGDIRQQTKEEIEAAAKAKAK